MTQKQIIDAADKAGWDCDIKHTKKGYEICFQTYSPYGQDVNCEIEAKTLEQVPDLVHEFWQGYDPEAEAMLWYGANRGEPKSLRELLDDMDWVDNKLQDLSAELCNI